MYWKDQQIVNIYIYIYAHVFVNLDYFLKTKIYLFVSLK